MSDSNINKKVFHGLLWESSTKFIIQIASWSSTIIVARLLEPEDYGLVAISGIFTGLLMVITELGLAAGLINKKEVSEEEKDIIFWLGLTMSSSFYLVLFFAAPYIATFYLEPDLVNIIRVAGSMLIFSSLKIVPMAILMRDLRFKYTALTQMTAQAVNITTVLILAYKGFGFWALIYSVLASQIVQIFAYLPLMKRFPRPNFALKKARYIISFGSKMMASKILKYITSASPTFIIATFLGSKKVGYYDMSATISNLPMDKIGSIFNRVTFPTVSKIQNDYVKVKSIFLNLLKYMLIVVIPVFFTIFIAAEELVLLLLTEKWLPIVGVLKILIIMNIFRLIGMLVPSVLNGLGFAGEVLKFNLYTAILVPIAIVIGVQWGIEGAVIGLFVIYPSLNAYLFFVLGKKLNILNSEVAKIILPPVSSGIIMIITGHVISHYIIDYNLLIRTGVIISFSMVSYLICLYAYYRKELPEMKRSLMALIK